ncbi:MAG: hypothetical protein VCB24_00680 [Pseudomonas sp.]
MIQVRMRTDVLGKKIDKLVDAGIRDIFKENGLYLPKVKEETIYYEICMLSFYIFDFLINRTDITKVTDITNFNIGVADSKEYVYFNCDVYFLDNDGLHNQQSISQQVFI